jgi:hypothetical protein
LKMGISIGEANEFKKLNESASVSLAAWRIFKAAGGRDARAPSEKPYGKAGGPHSESECGVRLLNRR